MLIRRGEFYLGEDDPEALDALGVDEAYVRRRYEAVRLLLQPNPATTARQVAERLGVSRRTVKRWKARYRARGAGGLREDSRRPRRIRRKVTPEDEAVLLAIRRKTGFGPDRIKILLDAARRSDPGSRTYSKRTILKVLQRQGIVAAQRKVLQAWRTFEWGHPRDLVQLDLTDLGPVPIATAVDDHSRRLWAVPLEAATDDEVFDWMEGRVPRFRHLLTDNGPQFDRANGRARAYCDDARTRHIWATKGHPQTLGKLSRAQRDLKRALVVAGWADREDLARKNSAYLGFYNNACVNRRTRSTPVQREGGVEDPAWLLRFAHAFGLEDVLLRRLETHP